MAAVFRRVVLKPPGITKEQTSQLRANLEQAIEQQVELATRSRHVVQFTGPLTETETCFSVEHEPGRALATQSLYDQKASRVDPQALLAISVALMDSLKAGYAFNGSQPFVHGGVCSGVLLQTPSGVWRICDFGFVPAICAALGPDQSIELAVATDVELDAPRQGTAVWEILPADDDTRDDRICGFVDPHKYAVKSLATFEARSDIASSGILLHLLAEHRHPLLPGADEHRLSAVAESMAWQAYRGPRRPELTNSSNAAIRRWCELVDLMLSRSPEQRPDAIEIIQRLKEVDIEPIAIPGQTTSDVDTVATSDTPQKRKRGMTLVLVTVIALVAAVGIWLGVTHDSGATVAKSTVAKTHIEQPTRASTDSTIQAIRDMLSQSRFLKRTDLTALVTTQGDGLSGDLEVSYTIPGLTISSSVVVIAEPELGKPWVIPESLRSQLVEEATSLDDLLGAGSEADMTIWAQQTVLGSSTSSYVTPEDLRARFSSPPNWQLKDDRWLAPDTAMVVSLETGANGADVLNVLETTVELIAEDGQVRATLSGSSTALDAKLSESIRKAVISQQARSGAKHMARLTKELADVSPQLSLDPQIAGTLAMELPIIMSLVGQASREVVLVWNPTSLSYEADPAESEVVTGFRNSWSHLASLNDAVQHDRSHWLHEAYADGFKGLITETAEPQGGRWRLAVPAPWALPKTANDPMKTAAKLPLEMAAESNELPRPEYWPVILKYAKLTKQPFYVSEPHDLSVFNVAIRASGGKGVQSLVAFLNPQSPPQYVFPRFELPPLADSGARASAAPVFQVGENTLNGSLTVSTLGRFSLQTVGQPSSDPSGQLVSGLSGQINLERVDQAVRSLFLGQSDDSGDANRVDDFELLPTATLTLTVDQTQPDGVAVNFGELNDLAAYLFAALPKVSALDTHISTFSARDQIERDLESTLTNSQGRLDETQAYELLKRIWHAKGANTQPVEADLASFSKSRQRKLRSHMTKRRLVPTVFVEYFCGPTYVYAVVFSVAPTSSSKPIPEGVSLVRLCTVDELSVGATLGDKLVQTVLAKVPSASESPFGSPFSGRVGIVFAVDALMSPKLLPNLVMSQPIKSYLEPSGELTSDADNLTWASLTELRESDQMGDYTLVGTLVDSGKMNKSTSGSDELQTLWVWHELTNALNSR